MKQVIVCANCRTIVILSTLILSQVMPTIAIQQIQAVLSHINLGKNFTVLFYSVRSTTWSVKVTYIPVFA